MDLEKELFNALNKNVTSIKEIYAKIYKNYYKLLFYIAYKYVKDDAEDIVQEVFINFFNNIPTLKKIDNIQYYLVRSVKNTCINYLKRENRKENLEIEISYFDENNTIFYDLEKNLTKEEMQLLIDHVLGGLSFKEIAENNKENINSVKSKYLRMIKKIKGAKVL